MDALIITEQQAIDLEAANGNSIRRLKPRRLQDGRLILNADVLDDPFFVDPARGWARVLISDQELNQVEQSQTGDAIAEVEVGVGVEAGAVLAQAPLAAGIQRAILTEAELA